MAGRGGDVLTAVPTHWYSQDFTLRDGDRTLAELDFSSWRERGVLTIDGRDYRVYREGAMSGAFILELDGTEIARAEKPSAFHRMFIVRHAGQEWELRAASALRRKFVLLQGSNEVGVIAPEHAFSRRAAVDLRVTLPAAVQAFIVWLTLLLWKRERNSG
jgi:hypothetical protein